MPAFQHISLVALRTVRYNDRHSILSAYTLEGGRMAFLVPAGATREATRRRALLMPLSLVECNADIGSRRDIHTMRDVMPLLPLHGLHSHPVKASVAMFMAEVLGIALRENQGDKALFAFLVETVARLADCPSRRLANFHIAFLRLLTRFVGIEPDFATYTQGAYFDMTDGRFRLTIPVGHTYLSRQESAIAALLGRIGYHNHHLLRLTRDQRNHLTDTLLSYFTLHHAPLTSLTTLPVLRSL